MRTSRSHRNAGSLGSGMLLASLVLAALVAPVAAKVPDGTCAQGFMDTQFSIDAALKYKADLLGQPIPEAAEAYFRGLFETTDRNANGLVCMKDLPDTPGIPSFVNQLADDVTSS